MITFREFRTDKDLVVAAREYFGEKAFQLMLEACESVHPCRRSIDSDANGSVSDTAANIELGLQKGYSLYSMRMKMLTMPLSTEEGAGLPESEYIEEKLNRQKPVKTTTRKKKTNASASKS